VIGFEWTGALGTRTSKREVQEGRLPLRHGGRGRRASGCRLRDQPQHLDLSLPPGNSQARISDAYLLGAPRMAGNLRGANAKKIAGAVRAPDSSHRGKFLK